jgi:hypothetical protein
MQADGAATALPACLCGSQQDLLPERDQRCGMLRVVVLMVLWHHESSSNHVAVANHIQLHRSMQGL